jgi:hypothetical protein
MFKKSLIYGLTAVVFMAVLYLQINQHAAVDFSTDVKPILNKHCISCHGGVKKNAGFSLLFEADAFAPTESGIPAIVPGNTKSSSFIQRLHEKDPELRMPYNKPALSPEEIDVLTRWVKQGAQWGKHWAYRPVQKPDVPKSSLWASQTDILERDFNRHGIDYFISEKLKKNKLVPSPEAEPMTLLRRVALDITGLPPSESLVSHWKQGQLSYENMVDQLLATTSFGEKWASWWLDLARYSDTKGYERDVSREIWAYRDWVIKALNDNMPFDQFTIEQLAGDLLPKPSLEQLTATAFHRNTMNNDEGGTEDEEFRVAAVMDRINTTFEVWQSTTIACVQCHSHPYDPFQHEDYFQLMAFFNNTRDEDTHAEEPKLKFYSDQDNETISKIKSWVGRHGTTEGIQQAENFLLYQEPKYHAHDCEDFVNGELIDTKWLGLWDDGSCYLRDVYTGGSNSLFLNYWTGNEGSKMTIRLGGPGGEILSQFILPKTNGRVIHQFPFKSVEGKVDLHIHMENKNVGKQQSTSTINWFAFVDPLPGKREAGYKDIEEEFSKLLNTSTPTVPIMIENPDFMRRETKIFERGNWMMLGESVKTNVPQQLNAWRTTWPDNRLGLAYWLTDPANPLTARTVVNRIWAQLFGRGLVATLEDMGTQSEEPSHPELMDWLAWRFMHEHNWQLKGLIKDIILSGTYRQTSISSPELHEKDPQNKWYARGPRFRMSAEQIRDQSLSIAGLLSPRMYGKGVMPPQPDNVWQTVYNGESWKTSEGEDRYRRAVYTFLKRTSPYPSFITFDAGSREVCSINRTVTNTPLQALVTLNDPVYLEAAFQFARSMKNAYPDNAEKAIAYGYEKALYIPIPQAKLKSLIELYQYAEQSFKTNRNDMEEFLSFSGSEEKAESLAALMVVANAILNLDEFLTKS